MVCYFIIVRSIPSNLWKPRDKVPSNCIKPPVQAHVGPGRGRGGEITCCLFWNTAIFLNKVLLCSPGCSQTGDLPFFKSTVRELHCAPPLLLQCSLFMVSFRSRKDEAVTGKVTNGNLLKNTKQNMVNCWSPTLPSKKNRYKYYTPVWNGVFVKTMGRLADFHCRNNLQKPRLL